MKATDPMQKRYEEINAAWRGVDLTIRHCADWCVTVGIDHIEVVSDGRVALPITETGYKSYFIPPEQIAEIGTPADYVLAWLDHAADSTAWKKSEFEARQLSLF